LKRGGRRKATHSGGLNFFVLLPGGAGRAENFLDVRLQEIKVAALKRVVQKQKRP
jgi:hypothetical protein